MTNSSFHAFIEEATGESHLRVEHDFGDGFVRLQTSEADRRQAAQDIQNNEAIVVELLRNSRDAHASSIFVACSREGAKRHLTVIDDGDGIPPSMHAHVFEPRVTSKLDSSHMDAWGLHGRGMALYSISVHADFARVCSSDTGFGCALAVVTDAQRLPEKTDQSSFPTFELAEGNKVNVRGPKNILRTVCEFAIEARNDCAVYCGTPAEVASTLYMQGKSSISMFERTFCKDAGTLPIVKRLAVAADPADFSLIAESLGLDLSERTARRILDGDIGELEPILNAIEIRNPADGSRKRAASGKAKRAAVKLGRADTRALAESVSEAFCDLAEKYYLDENVEPSIAQKNGRLVISVPLVRKP